MKKIGLLFTPKNRALVRAGLKTQTRRLMKPQPEQWDVIGEREKAWAFKLKDGNYQDIECDGLGRVAACCPYGNPHVEPVEYCVKEPVQIIHPGDNGKMLVKWLDDGTSAWVNVTTDDLLKIDKRSKGWESPTTSMFMLRSFARNWLPGVRTWPERLGDLSAADAIAEGIEFNPDISPENRADIMSAPVEARYFRDYLNGGYDLTPVQSYASLWQSINGQGSWDPRRWVWCVEWQAPTGEGVPLWA